jgi:hypothetical protein
MAPATRSAGMTVSRGSFRQRHRTSTTAMNDTALMRNTPPEPTADTRRPPMAGPTARAMLVAMPLSATASVSSRGGTRSGVVACQAGVLRAIPNPIVKVRKRSSHGVIAPATVRRPERHGGPQHPALGDEEEAPAVHDVGQGAGGEGEEQDRQAGGGLHERHHQRGGAERRHQPRRGGVVHPGADVGGDGGDPERAEDRPPERRPCRLPRGAGWLYVGHQVSWTPECRRIRRIRATIPA